MIISLSSLLLLLLLVGSGRRPAARRRAAQLLRSNFDYSLLSRDESRSYTFLRPRNRTSPGSPLGSAPPEGEDAATAAETESEGEGFVFKP